MFKIFAAILVLYFHSVCAIAKISTEDIYENIIDSVCLIESRDSHGLESIGSGFFVSDSGEILTNKHVVDNGGPISVRCGSKAGTIKHVSGYSVNADLVVLQSSIKNTKPIPFSESNYPRIGSPVLAIGSPFGLSGTITPGIISNIVPIKGVPYLQMTAPISPGNSGGPVLDETGKLIGVSTLQLNKGQNINFALPVKVIKEIKKEVVAVDHFFTRSEIMEEKNDNNSSKEIDDYLINGGTELKYLVAKRDPSIHHQGRFYERVDAIIIKLRDGQWIQKNGAFDSEINLKNIGNGTFYNLEIKVDLFTNNGERLFFCQNNKPRQYTRTVFRSEIYGNDEGLKPNETRTAELWTRYKKCKPDQGGTGEYVATRENHVARFTVVDFEFLTGDDLKRKQNNVLDLFR